MVLVTETNHDRMAHEIGKNYQWDQETSRMVLPKWLGHVGPILQENDDNLSDLGGGGNIFRYVQSKPDGITPTSSERMVGVPKFSVVTGSGCLARGGVLCFPCVYSCLVGTLQHVWCSILGLMKNRSHHCNMFGMFWDHFFWTSLTYPVTLPCTLKLTRQKWGMESCPKRYSSATPMMIIIDGGILSEQRKYIMLAKVCWWYFQIIAVDLNKSWQKSLLVLKRCSKHSMFVC